MKWIARVSLMGALSSPCHGVERDFRIPDEYELAGSSTLGVMNAGVAQATGIDAIYINPALLVLDREYSVSASYHWPTEGRDYYRLGIVDGKTSQYAAGASYVGFQGDANDSFVDPLSRDSRVLKRASLGVAYPFRWFAVGIAGYYVEGLEPELEQQKVVDGLSLGVGAVAYLARSLRVGLSAQNLNNDKVQAFAPRFYKAGLSWDMIENLVSLHADYRQRERVKDFEGSLVAIPGLELDESSLKGLQSPEKMVFLGGKATVYNLLKVATNFGTTVGDDERRSSIAGSIGVYQKDYSFVYTVSQPHMNYSDLQSALTLQVFMKI
ncbi:hypothetical protein [Pseudobacteriovorax antillogorgiicola]|uniref:PorV/PorQ family protein n=1 Tax=Pseudobacteriovorax antillogorgiicola TaxID=1513793 RepID=A0A1Y6BAP8_9BACT|nr:hypothetical protein [Pseudobacteriovorax antillogorgiicola]TCS59181.1 hypothetical protein EDD56_10184 [Pseudobacteriovorax antillogorgiicola]SME90843.1 hypothetical protein SAMN06296036_101402 [Pseudobacteriovorax antillogorgiicola]